MVTGCTPGWVLKCGDKIEDENLESVPIYENLIKVIKSTDQCSDLNILMK